MEHFNCITQNYEDFFIDNNDEINEIDNLNSKINKFENEIVENMFQYNKLKYKYNSVLNTLVFVFYLFIIYIFFTVIFYKVYFCW